MTLGEPVGDLAGMLSGMAPRLDEGAWHFAAVAEDRLPPGAFALIREDEGLSTILPGPGAPGEPLFARITLGVHSALDGVGLTAAVAGALAGAGIACNVVAGLHHDHLFVPWDRRDEALAVLRRLAASG